MKMKIVVMLALVAVLLAACGNIGLNLEDGAAVVTVRLPETEVQRLLDASTVCEGGRCQAGDDEFFSNVTGIEFRDGLIHVTGEYDAPDGTLRTGSYDVRFGAEDGRLIARLINVDVAGVEQSRIDRINAEMAADFAKTAAEGDVQFQKAEVTDSELVLEIRAALGR